MASNLIIIFFSVWFLVNVLYIWYRKSLWNFGSWLHRYGWINEWSMFTNQSLENKKYQVSICDFDSNEESAKWNVINLNQIKGSGVILNPNFKLDFFVSKCLKKMNASYRVQQDAFVNQEVFDYLCACIVQFPNAKKAKFRKVKIENRIEGDHWIESIRSKAFELK